MSKPESDMNTALKISIYFCFFISGAAGLIYEIVWLRMLGLVFGHTVFALTTVLAAFMAGLALGSYLFGRLIDVRGRPLTIYGLLEIAVAIYAVIVPFLFAAAQSVYLWLYRALGLTLVTFSLARFVLIFSILLVPTTLMGASLPVLAKLFVTRRDNVGRNVGALYASNTFGAIAGSLAAGFYLLPAIGGTSSIAVAAALNLGVGGWSLLADVWRRRPEAAPVIAPSASESVSLDTSQAAILPLTLSLVLAGIGLSGAASMIYEVAWTRALRLVIGSSTYAFSTMLTTFLVGLALGSFLCARLSSRRLSPALFGWLEMGVAAAALALIPAFERMPDWVLTIFQRATPSPSAALGTQFLLSFVVMIVPTTLIGAAFPCAVQICARGLSQLGRDVGRVYAVNTAGTIVGALSAGFLLVPWLGAQRSIIVAAALNAAVGAAVLFSAVEARSLVRSAAVAAMLLFVIAGTALLPRWDRQLMIGGVFVYAQRFISADDPMARFRAEIGEKQLLFYREGINSTVAVERTERMTSLKVDGKVDASNGPDMLTQLMLGHLPLLIHPRPERALVIGLGSGVTAGAIAAHSAVREIDVVELEPAIVEASIFFAEENRHVFRDPRVRIVTADARNFILAGEQRYDVISSEPSNPWMAGVANLFSAEFYRMCRRRLADGGVMVQWVQGYSLFPREFKMIVGTFRETFPHSTLWRTIRGDYLLVGAVQPLLIDYALLAQRLSAAGPVREDAVRLGLDTAADLFTYFLLDEPGLARFAERGLKNTDDKPLLEFAAPLALYADTTDLNARLLREARAAEIPAIVNLPSGALEASRLHFARTYWARGEKEEALEQFRKAAAKPQNLAAEVERAKLLFSMGEIAEATRLLKDVAARAPHDRLIASYLRAGVILSELKAEGAIAEHGRTRHGDPNPAEAHNNLGIFYTRLGIQFQEPVFFTLAADALEAALHLEPRVYSILYNLGNVYFELGRLGEAVQVYTRGIELAPRVAEARFNLGLVYESQKKFALATREFQTAVALKPDWPPPRLRLARLQRESAGPFPERKPEANR